MVITDEEMARIIREVKDEIADDLRSLINKDNLNVDTDPVELLKMIIKRLE